MERPDIINYIIKIKQERPPDVHITFNFRSTELADLLAYILELEDYKFRYESVSK